MPEAEEHPVKKITNPINYKVLAVIFALVVAYQYSLYQVDPEAFHIPELLYLLVILTAAGFSFMVSKRYKGSVVFGKAYFFLGMAFVSWFIGDIGYVYYDYVLELDPYPNPFDVGFVASYIFACLHLYLNIRYFKRQWGIQIKSLLVILPIVITLAYLFVAYEEWGSYEELHFDLFYGGIFIALVSVELAFAIIGTSVFRQSALREVWLLFLVGIFLWTFADVWYYYVEIFEGFDSTHPTNTIWIASLLTISYALYKHRQAI